MEPVSDSSGISDYLAKLDDTVLAGARRRRRIVEEAEDHLAEAVDRYVREGLSREEAERKAITDFGEATTVADAFAQSRPGFEMLIRSSRRLALAGAVLFALVMTAWRIDDDLVPAYIAGVPALLLLAALPGLHLRQAPRSGLLGRIGFFLISAAAVTSAVLVLALAGIALFYDGQGDPAYAILGVGIPAAALLIAGLILFAASALRAKVFPPGAVVLLLVTSAALPWSFDKDWPAFPSLLPAWLFAAAWTWLALSGPLLPRPVDSQREQPALA